MFVKTSSLQNPVGYQSIIQAESGFFCGGTRRNPLDIGLNGTTSQRSYGAAAIYAVSLRVDDMWCLSPGSVPSVGSIIVVCVQPCMRPQVEEGMWRGS
jgi:hypothetical protein